MVDKSSAEIVDMDALRVRRMSSDDVASIGESVGALLRLMREQHGHSLADVAAKTQIKESHLTAIEEMDLDSLPVGPYVSGFIRTYAEFLNMDSAAVSMRFKIETDYKTPAPEPEKFERAEVVAEEGEPTQLSLTAVVAIIAFILWCAWQVTLPQNVKPLAGTPYLNAAVSAPPLSSDSDVLLAAPSTRVEPIFPYNCLTDANASEFVVVSFSISAGGRVVSERVASTSNTCFGQSALNAVRRWQFDPHFVDGTPRPVYDQQVRLTFTKPD